MPRREYLIWCSGFLFAIILAGIFIFFSPLVPLSPYAGDIFGSMIGFMLVITFAEIVKLDERRGRAKKTEEDILEEISEILNLIETGQDHIIPFDTWEMAVVTGNVGLLDSTKRRRYNEFYRYVRSHQVLTESYEQRRASIDSEAGAIWLKERKDVTTELLKRVGELVLEDMWK